MTQETRREPIDYATPHRADEPRAGAGMLLFTGLALVLFGGILLVCGASCLNIEHDPWDRDTRNFIMFFIGVFSFTCLGAGLTVIRAGMRRA